jgi:diacylglycerol O-acyltransferase / wax synthase
VPDPVAGLDAGFLLTETSTMPWHVLGVLLLDPASAPEPFTVDTVRRLVEARLEGIEAFHKVVVRGPVGVWPHWADAVVDLDEHLHVADLPPGAGMRELEALVARIAEVPLNRSRPLWELHVAEHLAGGRVGIIAKVHHALADGVTAVGILGGLLDLEPLAPGPPAIDLAPPPPRASPGLAELPRIVWRAGWAVSRATVRAALRGVEAGRHSFGFLSARTSGHAPLTSRRQVALATLPVDRIMRAKAAYGVTFNDIVLASIAGAARGWLDADGQLPSKSLLAAVPVSIRSAEGDPLPSRNQVSVVFVSLPVHVADPAERARLVGADTTRSKRLHEAAGVTALGDLAAVAPWRALGALWRAAWWTGAARVLPPAANLVVSSVPGPRVPLFLAGARLVALYPVGPLVEGVPLNITAVGRGDDVEIGMLSCPDLLPDLDDLAARLPDALDELLEAAPRADR